MPEPVQMLSIHEVSQRLNVTKHTLRFWEKKLDGIIVPLRTPGGQRRYTPEHLFIIEKIKKLKNMGLSLVDIKIKLGNTSNNETEDSMDQKIDHLANRIADMVKLEIYTYFKE